MIFSEAVNYNHQSFHFLVNKSLVLPIKGRKENEVPEIIDIQAQFKNNTESALYGSVSTPRNELVIRIQPDPAIWMKVNTQQPGLESRLMQSELDLTYSEHVGMTGEINAYTRLLLDVLRANQSSFVRSDELKEAWKIFTPVLHQIDSEKIIKIPSTI